MARIRAVICTTRDVGVFGTIGVVKDARSGRRLAETGIKPYRSSAAIFGAEGIAAARGWRMTTKPVKEASL